MGTRALGAAGIFVAGWIIGCVVLVAVFVAAVEDGIKDFG